MTQTKPKLIVLGHARHGKDTVAEILRDKHDYSFESSSFFCAERVMMPYFEAQGTPYANVDECYADRVNHRATWFDQIRAFNGEDPARLIKGIYENHDIYVGMRNKAEFAEARKLADVIVWVDASGRGIPPEPKDSFDIEYEPETMKLIRNYGDLADLEQAVAWFVDSIKQY